MTEQTNDIQRVLTVTGVLSYAFLAQPFASKSDDGSVRQVYKTQVLIDPTSPDVQKIKQASREVAAAAWGNDPKPWTDANGATAMIPEWETIMRRFAMQDASKLALRDGNFEDGEEYKGKLFISCNGKKPPSVVVTLSGASLAAEVDKALKLDSKTAWANAVRANNMTAANVPIGPDSSWFPRSTDKCSVVLALYAQSPKSKPVKWGPRINCQLMGVQFLERGKGFAGGGRVARIDEFGINPADADVVIPASQPDVGNAGGLF